MLDFQAITRKYYAEWLDCDEQDFDGGVRYVSSPKRDVKLPGYSNRFILSIFRLNNAVIVSYSSKIQEQINKMKTDFSTIESFNSQLSDYLNRSFLAKIDTGIKFIFEQHSPILINKLVTLEKRNFSLFLNFRLALGQREWDGMRKDFEELSGRGYCIAKIIDGKAVSMTDPPTMPFMADIVQEMGISTLPYYRNKGYAKEVVSACISKIVSDGKCPLWSCAADNRASEQLAYSVGFKKFCDVYSVVLER